MPKFFIGKNVEMNTFSLEKMYLQDDFSLIKMLCLPKIEQNSAER